MATIRQRRLAKLIEENIREQKYKTFKEILILAGYSKTTATQVAKGIIQKKGVQESLEKLGLLHLWQQLDKKI